jgi:hypothetical protein
MRIDAGRICAIDTILHRYDGEADKQIVIISKNNPACKMPIDLSYNLCYNKFV